MLTGESHSGRLAERVLGTLRRRGGTEHSARTTGAASPTSAQPCTSGVLGATRHLCPAFDTQDAGRNSFGQCGGSLHPGKDLKYLFEWKGLCD